MDYKYVVAARVLKNGDRILCYAPNVFSCDVGDRVLVASSDSSSKYARLDCVCLSAPSLIDSEALRVLEMACPHQFPIRKVIAKYHVENFVYETEGEVANGA